MMWAWIACAVLMMVVTFVCFRYEKDAGEALFFTIIFLIAAGMSAPNEQEKPIEHPNGEHCNA